MKSMAVVVSLLFVILFAFTSGCRDDDQGSVTGLVGSPSLDGGEVTLSSVGPPVVLDPFVNRSWQARSLYYFIFDNLIDVDHNLQFVPRSAKSWEISPDLKSITFHLRDDVHWHDGRQFKADDVVYSFNRYRTLPDPDLDGKNLFENVEQIIVTNPFVIKVINKEPSTFTLADWIIEIVPKPPTEKPANSQEKEPPGVIGSGPYVYSAENKENSDLVLDVNEHYWNGRSHLDCITIRFHQAQDSLKLFRKGDLDHFMLTPDEITKDTIKNLRKKYSLHDAISLDYYYIGWQSSSRNTFFSHRRIRKAMTLALPRKKLLQKFFFGKGLVADVPVLPSVLIKNDRSLPFSPILAVDLLREVGCKDRNSDGIRELHGVDFKFKLLHDSADPYAREIAALFKENLRKLGVAMLPLPLPEKVLDQRIAKSDFDAFLIKDRISLKCSNLEMFFSNKDKNISNILGYEDPELNSLLNTFFHSIKSNDFEKQMTLIIDRIIEEQPCTVVFFEPHMWAVSPRLKMMRPCSRGLWEWYPSMLDWHIPPKKR